MRPMWPRSMFFCIFYPIRGDIEMQRLDIVLRDVERPLDDILEEELAKHGLELCRIWPLSSEKTVYGWIELVGWGATDGLVYIWGKAKKWPSAVVEIWEEGRDDLEEDDCDG